jgi:hypothetical protein
MQIEAETLKAPVSGVNLAPGTFDDQLAEGPTLLIFLRFFGCIFCRETVSDLRQQSEANPDFPAVLFVSEAGSTEARAFVRRYWPEARVIADPKAILYAAFGVGTSIVKSFSPGVFKARRRALDKGIEQGSLDGNAFRMPGAFLVRGGEVLWSHKFKHAADQPDFDDVTRVSVQAS